MATEVYELRIVGSVGQEQNECVLHFEGGNLTADDTFENGKSLIDSFNTNIKALWLACLPDSYNLLAFAARRATPKPSVVRTQEFSYNTTLGTYGTGMTADQLCPSVFLIPVMGTKTGGKVFMPCAPDSGIVNNQYAALYITAIDTLFAAMTANFGVSGKTWQQVVYSRKLTTFSVIVGWSLSGRFGFQSKRRKPVA